MRRAVRWGTVVAVWLAAVGAEAQETAPGSASAAEVVLVGPVQGSDAAREQVGQSVARAVRKALEDRGYAVSSSGEAPGLALIACQTPECVEHVLGAARASFGIVPAIWARGVGSNGRELTLTLVQGAERNLNASSEVDRDLAGTVADLVDALLAQQAETAAAPVSAAGTVSATAAVPATATATATDEAGAARPHAWKAGPILLLAGGAGIFVAIGVAAGIKDDNQQLNTGTVAVWSAVGAAAIGGGVAWWVVGQKRRNRESAKGGPTPWVGLRPTGIDLRLRF